MPLDAESRLVLIRVKTKWAEKHLRNLAAEILALEHTTVLAPDPNTGVPPHPIALLHPNNFQKLPTLSFDVVTIAGDIVHNVRSALDHLAQHLIDIALTANPPPVPMPTRKSGFLGFQSRRLSRNMNPSKLAK